jgi:hypothetical protein
MTIKIPKYAQIIKGHWKKNDNYGDVWCKITEININLQEMSLSHPLYGGFSWVNIKDCIFSYCLPKHDKKTNTALLKGYKDGFYLYNTEINQYVDNVYSKKSDKLIYKWLVKQFGEWSLKTADIYSNFECHQYEDGDIIDNYSW